MALAVVSSGTKTADGTEQDLATSTTGKTYVLVVDTGAMVKLDITELRLYTKCLSGGTERQAYYGIFSDVQGSPMKYSVPVPANISLRATLKQIAGTNRSYPWSLLSLD
jgi:hypothetical protein